MGDIALTKDTPLADFINHKTNTGMQCGNYSIDLPELKDGEQYRFHFDATACVGCHCCEVACNEQNGNPDDIKWRRVGEMEAGVFPDTSQLFNSMSCNHCIDPACLNGCPTESYIKLDNGIVFHEDESCIGCQYCTWNCPYEVPVFNKDRGIVTKCHMCVDKLEEGETPACVQACPSNAIEIEVVNVQKWLDEDMAKEGVAPHLPDIDITKPTTRYTLPEISENEKFRPADSYIVKPAHKELPLVFMTVLTQISVGAFLAIFFGDLLHLLGFNLPAVNATIIFFAIVPALIGLPLSALHLGRPSKAYLAMKNWRHSWLSREAIAFAVFAGLGSLLWIFKLLSINVFMSTFLEAITVAIGIFGIYAQSMIYRVPARPSWNRSSTTKRFFGSAYLGFLLVSLVLLTFGYFNSAGVLLSITILLAALASLVVYEEIMFYRHLDKEGKYYYQLSRTKKLLDSFRTIKRFRLYSLIGFGIVFPLIASIFIASKIDGFSIFLLLISLIGGFVSELLGR